MTGGGAETPAVRWAREDLEAIRRRGLHRSLETVGAPQGPVVVVGDRRLINFSSNDYLSLAGDGRLAAAARAAMERHGVGAGASRLVVGDTAAHRSLERVAAEWMGAGAALLFNSGYTANLGVLSCLCGPQDVIFSDALNHASMVDGCRLSRARTVVYPHADLGALDELLATVDGRRKLVCTDAVFSMDGDRAPLPGLLELCRRRGAALLVDEAHALGVLGPTGAGLCEELGVAAEVDLRMGTLGKALGSFGAFVAGSREALELLVNRARSLVFSTALPAAVCAAGEEAISILRREPERREALWRNIRHLAEGLDALGLPAVPRSAIFPVVLGDPQRALDAAARLRERGLLVKPIRPPTVPEGTSRLRFALAAGHTEAHVQQALEAIADLKVRVAA